MSSSSSNNSIHHSNNSSSTNQSRRSVVLQSWQVKPKCEILVKGGGVEDDGVEFTLGCNEKFSRIYMEYSKLAEVNPKGLRLKWNIDYVSPVTTPFEKGMSSKEVLLAFGEDFETPIAVNVQSTTVCKKVFIMHDMMGSHDHEVHKKDVKVKLKDLYAEWGCKRGAKSWKEVIMYLKGAPLEPNTLDCIADTGLKNGATLYARITDPDVEVIKEY